MSFMDELQIEPSLRGQFPMFCVSCREEVPGVKRFKPGHPRVWINMCTWCGRRYVTMPPGTAGVRRKERSYVKASGQRSLLT